MMENNTIAAFHIRSNQDGIIKLNTSKMYHWHIPKFLRDDPIQRGDIVLVRTSKGKSAVLVMQVFREEIEETQKHYKRVLKVLERVSKKEKDLVH
ncbi:DUF5839 family protein [Heyndrickxia sporothermodurans]|uniref:DUF5839 family protein n=1 Tax=Heyndrickxia sporothermodurans TaxID=46224 RepID=UPI002DBD207E|nr:DUF5839 family protein [Heyndrickxia sporothermodurans]MEB6551121.1 DUF5839 family protein [Heyndrickxia sporothermodurans]